MIYLRSTPSNQAIHETLARKYVPDERRALMEALPIELSRWLEPPVFDLPR